MVAWRKLAGKVEDFGFTAIRVGLRCVLTSLDHWICSSWDYFKVNCMRSVFMLVLEDHCIENFYLNVGAAEDQSF